MTTLAPIAKTASQLALEAKIHSITQLRLIEILAERGETGMSDAAERIGISTAALTGSADTLERLGFIERAPLRSDRRRINLKLTGAGVAFAAKLPSPAPATA